MTNRIDPDDQAAAEAALLAIRFQGGEWATSGPLESLVGALSLRRGTPQVVGLPVGNLVAILDLRANAVTIIQKLAWLFERKRLGDLDDGRWFYFGASDIVGFHVLIRSLLDSVALAITRVAPQKGVTPTSFADLRSALTTPSRKGTRTRRALGDRLSETILSATWFEELRDVRDDLVHREAQTLLFPHDDEILFQVHQSLRYRIDVSAVMFNENIVNWTLYSALVVARLFIFLNRFAEDVITLIPLGGEELISATSEHPGYEVLHQGLMRLLGIEV